jgi:hypothetical protein
MTEHSGPFFESSRLSHTPNSQSLVNRQLRIEKEAANGTR